MIIVNMEEGKAEVERAWCKPRPCKHVLDVHWFPYTDMDADCLFIISIAFFRSSFSFLSFLYLLLIK